MGRLTLISGSASELGSGVTSKSTCLAKAFYSVGLQWNPGVCIWKSFDSDKWERGPRRMGNSVNLGVSGF